MSSEPEAGSCNGSRLAANPRAEEYGPFVARSEAGLVCLNEDAGSPTGLPASPKPGPLRIMVEAASLHPLTTPRVTGLCHRKPRMFDSAS